MRRYIEYGTTVGSDGSVIFIISTPSVYDASKRTFQIQILQYGQQKDCQGVKICDCRGIVSNIAVTGVGFFG